MMYCVRVALSMYVSVCRRNGVFFFTYTERNSLKHITSRRTTAIPINKNTVCVCAHLWKRVCMYACSWWKEH